MADLLNTNPPPESDSAADFLLDRWRVACFEATVGHHEALGVAAMERIAKQMLGLLCGTLALVARRNHGG